MNHLFLALMAVLIGVFPSSAPAIFPTASLTYVSPTGSVEVLRPFTPPPLPWSPGHRGVDLAADIGSPIRAANDGVVAFEGYVVDRWVISIDHADGIRTTYEPVRSHLKKGDAVGKQEVIGTLDAGHCEVGCLHWGARREGNYLDPLSLLRPMKVRLYPLESVPRPARMSGFWHTAL